MALGIRLDLKQSQQLVMTLQLQQAIKLLQMSNLELREFVEDEMESNPLIRVEEDTGGVASRPEAEPGSAAGWRGAGAAVLDGRNGGRGRSGS